jgi:D-arabinose 1-dehydrogenase-like Zn-dependent alcohol dehydrogenase
MRHWGVIKGKKVGVVGLGGLGHMAVKFAHALPLRQTRKKTQIRVAATEDDKRFSDYAEEAFRLFLEKRRKEMKSKK